MNKKVYIHYGHSEFIPEYVRAYDEVKSELYQGMKTSRFCNKLQNALWASPEDAELGWKDCDAFGLCKNDKESFRFVLKDNTKVLEIHDEDDIMKYVTINANSPRYQPMIITRNEEDNAQTSTETVERQRVFGLKTSLFDTIDFAKIIDDGYDAIELFLSENYNLHLSVFYGWDCDSIMIINPEIVEIIE